jgi:Gas vesicle synthesis protein GvpL/GvpF
VKLRMNGQPDSAGDSTSPDAGVGAKVAWAYAVSRELGRLDSGLTGVAGERVRVVTEGGLGVVVGDVDATTFGRTTSASFLDDLALTEKLGRAHHRVITCLAAREPVVPFRLGTIYPDDATIRLLLAGRQPELSRMLNYFRGLAEWGVKLYAEPPAGCADETATWERGASPAGPGAWRDHAETRARQIGAVLRVVAAQARVRPCPDPEVASSPARMLLNAAYLIRVGQVSGLAKTVQDLTTGYPGLRVEVTGPWPPYSFAGLPRTT